MQRRDVGGWTVTVVPDPGFELLLPQDEATQSALRRSPWLQPSFVTDDWALQVGSTAVVLDDGEHTVVVDPWLAFDDPAQFRPRLDALAAAGWQADDVDLVVNSHIDGIGANTDPATGEAAFPRARYLLPGAEMAGLEGQADGSDSRGLPLLDVERSGALDRVDERVEPLPGLVIEPLPGHNAGHNGVFVGDPPGAVVIGHLFLHPAQIANPDVVQGGEDPELLPATRRALLDRCCDEGLVLVGPLFAAPHGGAVEHDPETGTWRLRYA